MINNEYLARIDDGIRGDTVVKVFHEVGRNYYLMESFDRIKITEERYNKMIEDTKSIIFDITFDEDNVKRKKYFYRDLLMLLRKTDGTGQIFSVIIEQRYVYNEGKRYLLDEKYTITEVYISKQIAMANQEDESVYYLIHGTRTVWGSSVRSELCLNIISVGIEFRYDGSDSCAITDICHNGTIGRQKIMFNNSPVRFKETQKSLDLFVTDHLYDI